jgi:hypothetical protein
MPFSGNFTGVRLGDPTDPDDLTSTAAARSLFVEGRSEPPDDHGEIHVALPRDGKLLSVTIDAAGLNEWEAEFRDVTPPFEVDEDVFVIGVAMRPEPCDPFVWQGSFTIRSRVDR